MSTVIAFTAPRKKQVQATLNLPAPPSQEPYIVDFVVKIIRLHKRRPGIVRELELLVDDFLAQGDDEKGGA